MHTVASLSLFFLVISVQQLFPQTATALERRSSATTLASNSHAVDSVFFGMHETNAAKHGWPSVRFGTLRIWDVYPHTSWRDIHTAKRAYDWTNLDNLVNLAQSHGVDLVYTFGRTPSWASSRHTEGRMKDASEPGYLPENQQYWKDFVTAITARYAGKIKYWEIWNEPNAPNFWAGTAAQMMAMARDAYPIIKASDPGAMVLTPAPQGANAYKWMDSYLDAGGGAYADIVSFHGYLGSSDGVSNPPENIGPLIANMRSVMASHGQGSKELWDTEHSWGNNAHLPDQDQQSAWLARHVILSWSNGVARSIWYCWDNDTFGTLWNKNSNAITQAGIAYGEVYKWLVGATMRAPCSVASDSTWRCGLTRADGHQAEIIWNVRGSRLYTPASQFTRYRDLAGNSFKVSEPIQVGSKPVLLEN
jgi:hypothetical protein